jgi:hypothetical protein
MFGTNFALTMLSKSASKLGENAAVWSEDKSS